MIPQWLQSGVLPTYLGVAGTSGAMSPFPTDMLSFARQFGTTPHRVDLLNGLLAFREALRAAGWQAGFQWVDGSFVTDVERIRNRPPADIDVLTFLERPQVDDYNAHVKAHSDLFRKAYTKRQFRCDTRVVDLGIPPAQLVAQTSLYFHLFSLQHNSDVPKGMIAVDLSATHDAQAKAFLESTNAQAI